MPTVVVDNDANFSHYVSPETSLELPQLPSPPPYQQHYHHRFPAHFHPTYQSQLQHLPPPPPPPPARQQRRAQSQSQYQYPSNSQQQPRYNSPTQAPGRRFSAPSSTRSNRYRPSANNKKVLTRKPSMHHNQGPKWIHRQGLINDINYHWVETTSPCDDETAKTSDKPLVILLHGFPQFWYTWRKNIIPLSDAGYRVVAPDLRGFNLTDKPAAPSKQTVSSIHTSSNGDDPPRDNMDTKKENGYDVETLTSDVRALMLHLGHDEAHIVGHDFGGIVAYAFAARFPQHTSKLVVMSAPHLCQWRDVMMDYSSASCFQQTGWTCWYTLCCQLLPSWIPESVLSYHRSWILTHNMTASPSYASSLSCLSTSSIADTNVCAASDIADKAGGCVGPGATAGGCAGFWKPTDMDLYRDAISKPGAIYALLAYYRNLWQSIHQMEQYGKIRQDLPILVLWGRNDKTFPQETYAKGWDQLIESPTEENGTKAESLVTVTYLDCGHFAPEEAPEDVNRHLLDFLGPPSSLKNKRRCRRR